MSYVLDFPKFCFQGKSFEEKKIIEKKKFFWCRWWIADARKSTARGPIVRKHIGVRDEI